MWSSTRRIEFSYLVASGVILRMFELFFVFLLTIYLDRNCHCPVCRTIQVKGHDLICRITQDFIQCIIIIVIIIVLLFNCIKVNTDRIR